MGRYANRAPDIRPLICWRATALAAADHLALPGSHANRVEKVRRAEALGYDVLSVPDHLGLTAPFPALSLAAEATERITLDTFVLHTLLR